MKEGIKIKKADVILVAGILAAALAAFLIIEFAVKKQGGCAVVTVDGKEYGTYRLSEDATVTVENGHGNNVIIIEGGSVRMEQADCPDRICVNTGKISRTGETIVCLPHRIVIEIKGTAEAVDGVAQ